MATINTETYAVPGLPGEYTVRGQLVLSGGDTVGKIAPGYNINGSDVLVSGSDLINAIATGSAVISTPTGATAEQVEYLMDTTVEPNRPYIQVTGTANTTYNYQYSGQDLGAQFIPADMPIYT